MQRQGNTVTDPLQARRTLLLNAKAKLLTVMPDDSDEITYLQNLAANFSAIDLAELMEFIIKLHCMLIPVYPATELKPDKKTNVLDAINKLVALAKHISPEDKSNAIENCINFAVAAERANHQHDIKMKVAKKPQQQIEVKQQAFSELSTLHHNMVKTMYDYHKIGIYDEYEEMCKEVANKIALLDDEKTHLMASITPTQSRVNDKTSAAALVKKASAGDNSKQQDNRPLSDVHAFVRRLANLP